MDQLQILCNNLSTGYQQNECCREGFAYSTLKPKQEKKTRKYVHSLYENVSYYSPSVCGTYINVADFKDGLAHPVEFEVNLPFDNILALQAFDLYPNAVCYIHRLIFLSKFAFSPIISVFGANNYDKCCDILCILYNYYIVIKILYTYYLKI